MHRIPKDTDLSALAGKSVIQICLGAHQVIMRLDDDLYISIEGDFAFGIGSLIKKQQDYKAAAKQFVGFLEDTIAAAGVVDDDHVVVKFVGGEQLNLFDSSEWFESFQIKLPDRLIVV